MQTSQISQTFPGLMAAVRNGLPAARERLVKAYGEHLLRAVRRRLPRFLRPMYDSADFAQSIWKSFFARHDRFGDFPEPQQLVAYLANAARNKTIDEVRRNLQTSPSGERQPWLKNDSQLMAYELSPTPTPSQEFVARETLSQIKAKTTSAEFRVIELKRFGFTLCEIATRLGIHEKSAGRVIRRLERKLEDERSASSKDSDPFADTRL